MLTSTLRLATSSRLFVGAKHALEWALGHPALGRAAHAVLGDEFRIEGCRIDVGGDFVSDEARASILTGIYEKNELRFVGRYLPSDLDVVELGSSLGVVSSRIAMRLAPGRRLLGVEANSRLLERARANAAKNAPGIPFHLRLGAVDYASEGEEVAFSVGSGNLGSHLGSAGATSGGRTVLVPRTTLSSVLVAHQVGDYSLVCDIEGAEAGLILAEREALSRCRCIIIELHDDPRGGAMATIAAKLDALLAQGFVLAGRSGLGARGPVVAMVRPGPGPGVGGQPP